MSVGLYVLLVSFICFFFDNQTAERQGQIQNLPVGNDTMTGSSPQ